MILNIRDILCDIIYDEKYFLYPETFYHSWNSANIICNRIGGHLPEFNSRKDLEEFVSFLKQRPNLPVLEAIYIGLMLDPDTSVSMKEIKH